jgi:hypothetical protein
MLGKFNALTWWDIYYNFSASLILVLDIICTVMQSGADAAIESRTLLRETAALAAHHRENPLMPKTMHKWASVTVEMGMMTEDFVSGSRARGKMSVSGVVSAHTHSGGIPNAFQPTKYPPSQYALPSTASLEQQQHQAQMGTDSETVPRLIPEATGLGSTPEAYATHATSSRGGQRQWAQLPFLAPENAHMWQDVHWDDIGNMLLGGDQKLV